MLVEIGLATDNASHGGGLPGPARTLYPISGTAQITITTAGFDPAVLTVTVAAQVTWYNATTTTHTLQSGEPYYSVAPRVRLRDAKGYDRIRWRKGPTHATQQQETT